MENLAQNQTTITTLVATQNSTDKLFGYSSVLSKDSTKVKDFHVAELKDNKKLATWNIEQNNSINHYKCEYSDNENYEHGTIGRYLQSVSLLKNEMLHSFGNTPIQDIFDFAKVFNIPVQLLNSELVSELCDKIVDFSSNENATSDDVRILLNTLDAYGLSITEQNEYASKIQSLTSLQKSYVYYKDKTSVRTSKAKWTDTTEIVLTCRFNSESDKKGYAHTIESIISDSIKRIKSNEKKSAKMSALETFDDKKAFLFAEIESSMKHYTSTALSVKVAIVEKETQTFNLDELL
jgi:hypothetical protein